MQPGAAGNDFALNPARRDATLQAMAGEDFT
jgi:hypothetical protein